MIRDKLERRKLAAYDELRKLIQDKDDFPINYNHYYTDNIEKRRRDRLTSELKSLVPTGIEHLSYEKCSRGQHYEKFNQHIPIEKIVSACLSKGINTVDMNNFSTEEIVDCLMAIYKVRDVTLVRFPPGPNFILNAGSVQDIRRQCYYSGH